MQIVSALVYPPPPMPLMRVGTCTGESPSLLQVRLHPLHASPPFHPQVHAMNRLARLFHSASPAVPSVAPTATSLPFVQQLRLYLGSDERQAGRPYCVAVTFDDIDLCWIDARRDQMLFTEPAELVFKQVQRLMTDPRQRLLLRPVAREVFEQIAQGARAMPMRRTLWDMGIDAAFGDAPLPPLDADTRLKLRRWPDFRVLAHRHDDFRICALMIKHGMTVSLCCTVLGLPRTQVQSFFNAAFLSGYAFPSCDGAAPLRVQAGGGLAGMWRQIRTRWGA